MLQDTLPIKITPSTWTDIAQTLRARYVDASTGIRIIVPTAAHVETLKAAAIDAFGRVPRQWHVCTLPAWLAIRNPDIAIKQTGSDKQALLAMYAELRNHAWVKQMFGVNANADLFLLTQTLLSLCNELTEALLPSLLVSPNIARDRWDAALEQLPAPARALLSDESNLVWTIWKSQLDTNDAAAVRYTQMLKLADQADEPLVWISSVAPRMTEAAFLDAYTNKQPVLKLLAGWDGDAVAPAYARAWPELLDGAASESQIPLTSLTNISLLNGKTLEDEAQKGAQTIVQWIEAGKSHIALIAQDRVVARRIRALLQRAGVHVADETGWKLSTTRAASLLDALLDLAVTKGKPAAVLELLKSPFMFPTLEAKDDRVLAIETVIRKGNVRESATLKEALAASEADLAIISQLETGVSGLTGSKTIYAWAQVTRAALDSLGITEPLTADAAGSQVMDLVNQIDGEFAEMTQEFTLGEWRTFVALQLESIAFVPPGTDTRVSMLPLNGARLRAFDAVLLAGADAKHLPSEVQETMFFANAVRRDLGLDTRESLQRQQMRDLTEVFLASGEVVLSRQTQARGENLPASPWVERLQLVLQCGGLPLLPDLEVSLPAEQLCSVSAARPAPAAAELTPTKLSPSGYTRLINCPYQYFIANMLRLTPIDDLSDDVEKRSYGTWLHEILNSFHVAVRDKQVADKTALLESLSERVFMREIAKTPTAQGYYARWKKVIPTYIAWTETREAAGWKFACGEKRLEKILTFDGGAITLYGRVDRLDVNDSGERIVLDYKSSNHAVLVARVKEGEDPQLPFYGILASDDANTTTTAADYVTLEMADVKKATVSDKDFQMRKVTLESSIVKTVVAIKNGTPMPANGTQSSCQYCEVKGLCRKSGWRV